MNYLISDICEFVNGGAWSDKEYSPKGIPVLKVSNLQSGGIDFNKIDFIPEHSRSKYSKHLLRKNDLVIATVGSHPSLINSAAGRATIIPANAEGYLLNQNAVCLRTKNSNILSQKYLAYIGKTNTFQHFIQQRGKGAANQMRIAIGAIKEYELDLPDIDSQRRIACVLSAYDDLIENNLKRIKLLEELAQRTYEEWFVKFRVNGEGFEMDEGAGLPVGWEELSIGNLIRFQKGKKPNGISSEYKEGFEKMLLLEGIESGKYSYANPEGQVYAKRGDLLMLMDGARSSKVFFADDGVVGSTIARISIIEERLPSTLLKHFFESNFELMQINNTGAAIPHANKNFINSMMFKIPSIGIINKWNNLIGSTYKQIQTLKDHIYRLNEARDILLPRLMNGTISVEVPETELTAKIIQLDTPAQKQAAPQFKEAILISLLTSKFGNEKYPLGRMRYTKLSYLFHRHADNQIKDYLRKAAGPYNPKTKYGGPEKIAHDNGYVADHKNGKLSGFIAGPNIEKAKPYFESYWDIEYLNWLEAQFKYKSNDELELFATVDNSLIELRKKNGPFTVEAVKNILKKEPEWTAKLEREIFNDDNIMRAITYLPTIFQY